MAQFPPFQLEDADGEVITTEALRGHIAVLYLARHPG